MIKISDNNTYKKILRKLGKDLQYYKELFEIVTLKNSIYGMSFTENFKNWIKTQNVISKVTRNKILQKIEEFNQLMIIKLTEMIKKETFSAPKIAKKLNLSKASVLKFAKKILSSLEYESRFPASKNHLLNEDYFEVIDTKEKAYWLGFLFADGCIYTYNKTGNKRLNIGAHKREIEILNRFKKAINAEYVNILNQKGNEDYRRIFIANQKLCKDLIKLGCVPRKSKILELPELGNDELNLAFLLGYFDGDGKTGSTRISSGSRKFLLQIKSKYNLKYKIYRNSGESTVNGKKIKGISYEVSLGKNLFREMLNNYKNSIFRKRIF